MAGAIFDDDPELDDIVYDNTEPTKERQVELEHNLQVVLAALEAVIGLFIELILIATFTRRFLGN